MQASNIPAKFPVTWGASAGGAFIRAIPTTSQIGIVPGAASLPDGFPPLTALPIAGGGIPPDIRDENGILNQLSAWSQWVAAGGAVPYDAAFQTAIAGYPRGAIVASATTPGLRWMATTENNLTNPDTGGAGWTNFPPRGFLVFSASGSWTCPLAVTHVKATVVGGGGGGAGWGVNCAGGGGGAGGVAIGLFTVVPGTVYTVTIGAGGLAGLTSANGGTGGASSFAAFASANGGQGGFAGAGAAAGVGGTASGGQLNLTGGTGNDGNPGGNNIIYGVGNGADGPFGGAGMAGVNAVSGVIARGPGSGGGGAYTNTAPLGGGPGAPGLILLEW